MPPLVVTLMSITVETNDPADPVVLFSIVDPSSVSVAPELAEIAVEPSIENVAPLLMVMAPVPMVMAALPLAFCTVPSSTVIPLAVIAEGTLTMNVPVASVPAEKTAVSALEVQAAVAELPVESVLQFAAPVLQVPIISGFDIGHGPVRQRPKEFGKESGKWPLETSA